MKKIIVKSLVMLAVIVGLVNYLVYLKTGQMPVKDLVGSVRNFSWSLPDMPTVRLPDSIKEIGNSAAHILPENQTRIYKWTDERGVVHYSEEAPLDIATKEMLIDVNTNLVKGLEPEEFVTIEQKKASGGRAYLIGDLASSDKSGINTEGPPLEQALEARELLDRRNQEQQKILDSL